MTRLSRILITLVAAVPFMSQPLVSQAIAVRGDRGFLPGDHSDTQWHGLADLDADGDLDLVFGGSGVLIARLRDNDGARFSGGSRIEFDGIETVVGGAFGDADGDGDLDVFFSTSGRSAAGRLALLLNDGLGNLTPDPNFAPSSSNSSQFSLPLITFDIDSDGDLDLLRGGTDVAVLINNGGTFIQAAIAPLRVHRMQLADLDRDGDQDLAIASSTHVWLRNDGGLNFTQVAMPTSGGFPVTILPIDVDADGDVDLIRPEFLAVDVLINDGRGTFTNTGNRGLVDLDKHTLSLDFDADNDIDLVSDQTLFRNDGIGNFFADPNANPSGDPIAPRLATDLDGDGWVDLITRGAQISVAFNGGGVELLAATTFEPDIYPLPVDVNGDGMLDIMGSGMLLMNDGRGDFIDQSSTLPQIPRLAFQLAVDVDADGDPDLVSRDQTFQVFLHLNDGTGAMQAAAPPPLLSRIVGASRGDFDADGDIDFLNLTDHREPRRPLARAASVLAACAVPGDRLGRLRRRR